MGLDEGGGEHESVRVVDRVGREGGEGDAAACARGTMRGQGRQAG